MFVSKPAPTKMLLIESEPLPRLTCGTQELSHRQHALEINRSRQFICENGANVICGHTDYGDALCDNRETQK